MVSPPSKIEEARSGSETPAPLVSVIVPAYNAAEHIEETLASVLGQTHTNLEVVVVDDGSSDQTVALLRACDDPRVLVIEQPNAGACVARNRGLREASGAFLQFLDADDLLSPTKIERQVALLAEAPARCLAVCGVVYFHDGTDPEDGQFSPGYNALNSDDPVQWLLDLWTPGPGYGTTRWGMVAAHAWLVPRSVADRVGPWDPTIAQDQDGEYFTRVLLASAGVRWEPEGRVYYRKFDRSGSVSSGRSERHLRGRLRAIDSKVHHVMPRTTDANRSQAGAVLARQYLSIAFHAHPAYPGVVREAEAKAAELGGYDMTFFSGTRLQHVERLAGWKVAKRISHTYHHLRTRTTP